MTELTVQARYDQFQEQAVSNIVADFGKKLGGRYLLVIPTGGGKTFTAVKAVNRLFEVGTLNVDQDRVLWTAHRCELIAQARETFDEFEALYPDRPSFTGNIDFCMICEAAEHLSANSSIKIVILDEAHHAALKNSSYGPIFQHNNVGILGLTATPSRHDGEPLEFERESFSIGFPDLVKKQIVLKPEVRKVQGGTYQITSIDTKDTDSLEQLNNKERNEKIIEELLKHTQEYKKIIIYVGTKKHAESLCNQLAQSPLAKEYESISFVTGDANSRGQERSQFIEQEKKYRRSVLVNVMVLSEGYDDRAINTVVMATPSKSKLYYMQAMGRAIRLDRDNPLKKAYCVEVEDHLPNIRYQIDNRWLFSDISDTLEPKVIDYEYGTAENLKGVLAEIYNDFSVPANYRHTPVFDKDQRYTMLLFKRFESSGEYAHLPLIIANDNRLQISNMYNFLSERMRSFKEKGIVAEAAFRMVGSSAYAWLADKDNRRWVYESMGNARPEIPVERQPRYVMEGHPWITFVALHYRQPSLPDELLKFMDEMINRNDIVERVTSHNFEKGSHLLRLPLPLQSYVGKIVSTPELGAVDYIVQKLRTIRNERGNCDHFADVRATLAGSIFPLELVFKDSLIAIARTDDPFSFKLG